MGSHRNKEAIREHHSDDSWSDKWGSEYSLNAGSAINCVDCFEVDDVEHISDANLERALNLLEGEWLDLSLDHPREHSNQSKSDSVVSEADGQITIVLSDCDEGSYDLPSHYR